MSVCLATCYVSIYLPACLPVWLSVGRSAYLSIMLCPSIYPSIFLSISAFTLYQKKNYPIEIGPKWLGAEMTHIPRPKQLNPKIGRKDLAEKTQGRNNPEPLVVPAMNYLVANPLL